MRKITIVLFLAVVVPAVFAPCARAAEKQGIMSDKFSLYYVERDAGCSLERHLVDNEPPMVGEVKIEPENPGPNDSIRVEAVIRNDPMMTKSRPIDATLVYSYDGGEEWQHVEMDEVGDGRELWEARIPAMGGPGEIRYFFTAEDDAGNMLLELPETDVEWGGVNNPKLVAQVKDRDDDYRLVPYDLDILEAAAGYDGKKLYLSINVEGEISSGTVTPFNVYVYSVGMYYPDKITDASVRTDLVLEHAQHAQFVMFPVVGLLNTERELSEIRTADARFYTDDGRLYMMFSQDVLRDGRFDRLRIIFGTAYATDYTPIIIEPVDTTMFINLVYADRFIEVEK